MWENLTKLADTFPVAGNKGGSYLTMFSKGGFVFGIINIIGVLLRMVVIAPHACGVPAQVHAHRHVGAACKQEGVCHGGPCAALQATLAPCSWTRGTGSRPLPRAPPPRTPATW